MYRCSLDEWFRYVHVDAQKDKLRWFYEEVDKECLDGQFLDNEWTEFFAEFYAEELRVGGLEVNLT